MPELIKYLHVLTNTTLFGGVIASYFYVCAALRQKQTALQSFTLKHSLRIDVLILLPAVIFAFITGSYLVSDLAIPLHTPWIITAYVLLSLAGLLLLINTFYKYRLYINLRRGNKLWRAGYFFHLVNIVLLITFILIIHDAVMKKSFWQYMV